MVAIRQYLDTRVEIITNVKCNDSINGDQLTAFENDPEEFRSDPLGKTYRNLNHTGNYSEQYRSHPGYSPNEQLLP
jgi:hypothetical protein